MSNQLLAEIRELQDTLKILANRVTDIGPVTPAVRVVAQSIRTTALVAVQRSKERMSNLRG